MSRINRFPKHSFNRIEPGHNPGPSRRGHAIKRFIRAALQTLVLLAIFQPLVAVANPATDLPGRVVAIRSKGAQKFVRSAGVDDGVLRADRDSYEANNEGRFLCFAEADGTFAFMDVMLERYLTHVGGQLTSAVTGAASTRRFTLVDQGNNYYALQADNGKHVRVDGAGDLVVDADTVTDAAVFSIVPIRTGPNVVMRAYGGDEADIFSSNPGDFPVNKVNIGMLQMTPDLYTDPQFTDMRAVWNTNRYETEFILPYSENPDVTLTNQVDRLVNRIKRLEGLGYTFDYVILYHEILANLPGGPWSDPRVCSQEEIDLFHARVTAAHNAGEVNHPSYKVFTMPYQFTDGSLMGIPPYQNTPVGCDAKTLEFIKNNFDGMFLEVNGHDYSSRDEDSDAAAAAVWCRDNGLEFGITSGGANNKDTNYKAMYGDIFTEMANAGFDKSWDKMHYVLHHVFQPYANRLPEWVANTTTENARWLIENVMPEEAPSISPTLDTDGDGVPDLQEALDGTFPLASQFAFNDYITDPAFGLDPAEQGFALDPDGDRIPNGLETWFGTHPGEFNTGLADLTTDGPVTTFTHPQNATPPSDLTGYYEWSSNLSDWYASGSGPGGGVTVTFSSSTTATTTTVTATVSGAPDRVFLRAGVMQN